MAQDWQISGRGHCCAVTGHPFDEGETFHALLFRTPEGFDRQDLSEEAWQARNENIAPFSHWRMKYQPPPPPAPEPLGKQTAEDLLRRYMADEGSHYTNARYILALMLERKRQLKPIETREENGQRLLIYEHRATGELFVIPDPELQLDQLAAVQTEIAALLAG